ncbi:MAG: hypothetical protein ACLFN8_00070 [Candidatus Woesearchaeota archaeon]
MKHKNAIILSTIFLIVLSLRLLIAFQTQDVTYDAYSTLRNIDNIKTTGLPLYQDDLSYSGRQNAFSPLYYYILAIFSLIIPEILVLKILPNIFATSIIFIVYLFAKHLSKNETAALISAGAAALIPVFFSKTINNASIYTLTIPLFFLALYYFIKTVGDTKNLWKFLASITLLTLTHASSLILALSLLIYVVLLKLQGFKKTTKEPELLLFSILLIIWANLTIYKRAIIMHGSNVIYQNTPIQIIFDIFKEITFIEGLYWIGTIPLLFGVIAIYDTVFGSRKKSITALIAVCITSFLLLWFRLINIYVGLMFLGISMSILASNTITKTRMYAGNLKLKIAKPITTTLIIILIIISFIPSINYAVKESKNIVSEQDKMLFHWIKNNTKENAIILTMPSEGAVLSYYTKRKNAIDTNYLLIPNIDVKYNELQKIYTDKFLIPSLTKLNYYSIDYILLSQKTMNQKNITNLFYEDNNCIEEVYYKITQNSPKLYKINCVVLLD